MEFMENPLFCFQHCNNSNIFCFKLPSSCPICHKEISNDNLRIPLFRLPNPVSDARNCPNSIVIKPTASHSFQKYSFGDDLHVGLADSEGLLFEYDHRGLSVNKVSELGGWDSCVAISVTRVTNLHSDFDEEFWSARLDKTRTDGQWSSARYNESEFNCFTYALDVLNSCCTEKQDKVSFCREVILPAIRRAMKYIRLYEQVAQKSVYVQFHQISELNR